jgi:hypothetical protein
MWEEKQVSELGRYGPGTPQSSSLCLSVSFDSPLIGITNYFKFTKWCFWIFVILTVINLPALVLNTFGRGDQQTVRLNSLSQTMVLSLLLFSASQSCLFRRVTWVIRMQHNIFIILTVKTMFVDKGLLTCSSLSSFSLTLCVSCRLSKQDIALMYGYLDFAATITGSRTLFHLLLTFFVSVLFGYLWLRVFETKEETVLNKNTGLPLDPRSSFS